MQISMKSSAFFDRPSVMKAVDRGTYKNMLKSGQLMRRSAKASMKRAPSGVASVSPMPPNWHSKTKKNPSGGGLRRSIMYGYDRVRKNVIVGPSTVLGANIAKIAPLHEFGGPQRNKNKRRQKRRIGEAGEIAVFSRKPRGRTFRSGRRVKGADGKSRFVVYATLKTSVQVERADRLNKLLYGPMSSNAHYKMRQTMRPTLIREKNHVTNMWRDSVK